MATETPRSDALPDKQPLNPAAGPYGHPFHPILITIPIGAWVSSLVLDLASYGVDNPEDLARGAYWLVGIGIVAAVLAALFGLLDLLTVPRGTRAFRIGQAHAGLNLVVVALFVVSFLIRRGDGFDPGEGTSGAALALSVVALALLLASGWLGGMLAYRYGVRVARETTQAEGYRA